MRLLLLILAGIALTAPAQDLKLYYRQADKDKAISKIYLVGVDPRAKITFELITDGSRESRSPQFLLLMPKPGESAKPTEIARPGHPETGELKLCNAGGSQDKCDSLKTLDGKTFRAPFIQITTSPEIEQALREYPGKWEIGRRFEAILTLKNLWIDGVPTTQTVNIPTTFEMSFNEGESIFEDGIVTFRVTWVPAGLEKEIEDVGFWQLSGAAKDIAIKGVAKFEADTRRLRFFLPNMVRQPETALAFQPTKDRLIERSSNKQEAKDELEKTPAVSFLYARRTLLGGRAPLATKKAELGRTRTFKTNAPVISQDLPLFIRGTYTNNRAKKPGQNVFNVEASFAADNDFALPPVWQNTLNQIVFTPHLKLDVNTARTYDNPNSIVWSMPLTFRHYFPGTMAGTTYRAPHFRLISFTSGIEGEHSGYGQTQNVLIPVKALLRYSTRPGAWRFGFDLRGGPEYGHSLSEAIQDIEVAGVDATTIRQKIKVENRNIRRMGGEAKFSLTQGKKVTLQGQWQVRKLYRDEQIITERQVDGTFFAKKPDAVLGTAGIVDTYTVLDTDFSKKLRRFGELGLQYAVTDNISVELTYKRGMKPPTFQYVNFVSVGFSFSLSKPKE